MFFPCESLDSYDVRYIGPVEKDIVFGKANVFSDEIYQFFFRNVKEWNKNNGCMAIVEYGCKDNSISDEKNKNILNDFNNHGCLIMDELLVVFSFKDKFIFWWKPWNCVEYY